MLGSNLVIHRFVIFSILLPLFFLASLALARPTMEEKSARRAAFWGLLADVYRARGCVSSSQEECARRALSDALGHAEKIDIILEDSSKHFKPKLKSVEDALAENSDLAQKELSVLIKSMLLEFAENSAPVLQPSLSMGQSLFTTYCESCHGDGKGTPGRLASELQHKPYSFVGSQRFSSQLPFGVYAVMIHGIDHGEMSSLLEILSVDELWSLAFYVASLPYQDKSIAFSPEVIDRIKRHSSEFALSTLATSTDQDLLDALLKITPSCGACVAELTYLRTTWAWSGETGRLSETALNPRKQAESRALLLLLGAIIAVSGGFIFVLKRSGRVEK